MTKKHTLSPVEMRIVRNRVEKIVEQVNDRAKAEIDNAEKAVKAEIDVLLGKFKETYRDQIWAAVRIGYDTERVNPYHWESAEMKPCVGSLGIDRGDGTWGSWRDGCADIPGLGRGVALLNAKLGKLRLSNGQGLDTEPVYFAGLNLTANVVKTFAPRFRDLSTTIDNGLLSGDAAAMLDDIEEWFKQEMSA
jgi:hypothetical protein